MSAFTREEQRRISREANAAAAGGSIKPFHARMEAVAASNNVADRALLGRWRRGEQVIDGFRMDGKLWFGDAPSAPRSKPVLEPDDIAQAVVEVSEVSDDPVDLRQALDDLETYVRSGRAPHLLSAWRRGEYTLAAHPTVLFCGPRRAGRS